MNTTNLQLFGDERERHIHPKKWHKVRDKRPLFVARCSQPNQQCLLSRPIYCVCMEVQYDSYKGFA